MSSFDSFISQVHPSLFFLQETKFQKDGKLKHLKGYQIYELIRKTKQCGGLAIGALEEIEPAFISEGDDTTEVLVIEVNLGVKVRCVNGYGPQENDLMSKKTKFWERLGLEVEEAISEGKGFLLQMDGNLHVGPELVPGDPNPCNSNGKLFKTFLLTYSHLTVVNSMDVCSGTITRKRTANGNTEEAVLDFFICCDKVLPLITKMVVNDDRKLARFTKTRIIESDHSPLELYFNMNNPNKKRDRVEIYDFKNRESQILFRTESSKTKSL